MFHDGISKANSGAIFNPATHSGQYWPALEAAARALGLAFSKAPVQAADELALVMRASALEPNCAVVVLPDPFTIIHRHLLVELAERHGVPVIEDAAQSHGATYRGKRVGQFGRIACFSFYPSKNLGAYGEGGALVTNDASIAQRARSLRDHAQSQKYLHDEIGYNYRMDSFQAAVLSIKLKHLDEWNAARIDRARQYTELLRESSYKLPAQMSDSESVWHCYVIETPERDRVRSGLQDVGIQSAVHYPVPIHLQKAYAHLGYRSGDLPVTEALCEHCLSLPIYPELSKEKISRVASVLLDLQSP